LQFANGKKSSVIAIILMFTMVISTLALTSPKTYAQSTDSYSGSYYSWPIDSQLTDWQNVTLEELNDGPLSAHVRWVEQFALGGVAGGGITGEHAFDIGDAYAGKWTGASILGGIAYWTWDAPNWSPTLYVATDIRTGEELWRSSRLGGSPFDQTIMTDTGIYSYLWRSVSGSAAGGSDFGTVYSAYDPYTCQWVYNITNIPSGSRTEGENGEFIIYSLSLSDDTMTYWNELWMLKQPGVMETLNRDRTINATEIGLTATWTIPDLPGSARDYRWGDRVIGTYESTSTNTTVMWAFSLEPGKEGTLLYNQTATYTLAPTETWGDTVNGDGPGTSVNQRLFGDTPFDSAHLHWNVETMKFWAYSYGTGEELWKSDDFNMTGGWGGEAYQNKYVGTSSTVGRALGPNYYHTGVSGVVYCYNATKGLIWTYHASQPYNEFQFSVDWWQGTPFAIADKVYFGHLEHSPVDPMPRGAPFFCLNATTGEVIWRVNGMYRQSAWGGQPLLGSGIILTQDTYDQCTWCIGKGPTSTTVTTPDVVVPNGGTAIIRGTVMDISPACSDVKVQLRFPQGVPAVSEESMSDWMCYVYKQFNRPANATGVEVTLSVLDSDGQVRDTATVTTDAYGCFNYEFATENVGEYSVKASFAGSNSYYGSFAVSSPFNVDAAPESTPEPTPEPVSMADLYFMPAIAGIVVALVVVCALLTILLLKRSRKGL
jgi:hypothetical protein